jgi:hypothetical protein
MRLLLFALCITTLCVPELGLGAPRSAKSKPGASVIERTRLKHGAPAFMIATTRSGRELRYLNVAIRNVGTADARGIQIVARSQSELEYPLKGAARLAPGQSSVYTLRGRVPIFGSSNIGIVARCANCSHD